ncbi:MAG: alpha/beta fold hydrolase [Deltaproteobacteria bacterium]|nr:alpha/beta fold hydrolase [Deltaproteobacteria bacterium]
MPTIASDGVTIHYRDEGRGPPVLLLHAFPLHAGMFDPQVAALRSKYRFILPDHRGFGRSGLGSGPAEMSQLAKDALAVLDALQIREAVIGGVSMGGYATMALLRVAPARARAILLLDTQLSADDDAGKANREKLARDTEARGMIALVESFLPRLVAPSAAAEVKERVREMIESNRPAGGAAGLRGLALRPDSRDVLAAFKGPTLVACGALDAITGPDKARAMADLLTNARLEIIPGAGHLANLENPRDFNRTLETFLDEVTRGP